MEVPLAASSSELLLLELLEDGAGGGCEGLERREKTEPPENKDRERARPISGFLTSLFESISEPLLLPLAPPLLLLTCVMTAAGDSGTNCLRGL